jgi:hypothetical protein
VRLNWHSEIWVLSGEKKIKKYALTKNRRGPYEPKLRTKRQNIFQTVVNGGRTEVQV